MKKFNRSFLVLSVVLASSFSALVASAYTFWEGKWNTDRVVYYVNPVNLDMSQVDVIAAIQGAADAWNQTNANIQLIYGGLTSATSHSYNGKNEIIFRNTSAGSLYGETWQWGGTAGRLESDTFYHDGGVTFFPASSVCYSNPQGVYLIDSSTHEFGHFLGIGHSSIAGTTMYPTLTWCGTTTRTLESDDIAAIEALYPATAPVPTTTSTTIATTTTTTMPPISGFSLSARGYKVKGAKQVDLSWSGAYGGSVDVYRNGSRIISTANDGFHTDAIGGKGGGSYSYWLCESGTSTCSNTVNVNF
jgi:hypothetical protein